MQTLIAHLTAHVPEKEDLEVVIAKCRISPSFAANPSMLARQILGKLQVATLQAEVKAESRPPSFQRASGQHISNEHVLITLSRDAYFRPKREGLVSKVQTFLDDETNADTYLEVPRDEITEHWQRYPAQLAYRVAKMRSDGKRILILQQKTQWKIRQK
jgi:hypothetical protein